MKGGKQIKRLLVSLLTLALITLLILSPCTVRNSVESVLGVQQTLASNKSKTTLKTTFCTASMQVQIPTRKSKISSNYLSGSAILYPLLGLDVYVPANPKSTLDNTWFVTAPTVPYYLLYKNFKAYLL